MRVELSDGCRLFAKICDFISPVHMVSNTRHDFLLVDWILSPALLVSCWLLLIYIWHYCTFGVVVSWWSLWFIGIRTGRIFGFFPLWKLAQCLLVPWKMILMKEAFRSDPAQGLCVWSVPSATETYLYFWLTTKNNGVAYVWRISWATLTNNSKEDSIPDFVSR